MAQLATEADGAGALLRRDVSSAGLMLSMTAGGSERYFHHDALGSTVNITGADASSEWTYRYEPFGTVRSTTQNSRKAAPNVNGFAGEPVDAGSALGCVHREVGTVEQRLGRTTASRWPAR